MFCTGANGSVASVLQQVPVRHNTCDFCTVNCSLRARTGAGLRTKTFVWLLIWRSGPAKHVNMRVLADMIGLSDNVLQL